jgi:hypothetical protein
MLPGSSLFVASLNISQTKIVIHYSDQVVRAHDFGQCGLVVVDLPFDTAFMPRNCEARIKVHQAEVSTASIIVINIIAMTLHGPSRQLARSGTYICIG